MPSSTRMPRVRVGAIIIQNGRVLMAEHTKDGRSYWMIPGGGVDFGETLPEALTREMREECCVDVSVRELVFTQDGIHPDHERHLIHLVFAATITAGEPKVGEDPRVSDVQWLTADQLRDAHLYPDIKEALLALLESDTTPDNPYLGNRWVD